MPREDNPQRATGLLRSYKRAIVWRRVMLALFGLLLIAMLFWAIPWFPYGLSTESYDERVTVLMGLVIMACLTAFGTVYHRDLSRRVEVTLLTWSTVHESIGDLRAREYFYDRIVIECNRASAAQAEFTVVAMRLEDDSRNSAEAHVQEALRLLRPAISESDCLAVLGPMEIGVLSQKTSREQAAAFTESVRSIIETGDEAAPRVRAGWAVYPVDAEAAGVLVALARERMLGKRPPLAKALSSVEPAYEVA
jgi:GGDEF domain-containing protein